MHSWVFRNREELARIYGLARSQRSPSKPPTPADPAVEAQAPKVMPVVRVDGAAPARGTPPAAQRTPGPGPARLPLARLGRFVLRPQPRARRAL